MQKPTISNSSTPVNAAQIVDWMHDLDLCPADVYTLLVVGESAGAGGINTVIKQARLTPAMLKDSYIRLANQGLIGEACSDDVPQLVPHDFSPSKASIDWARGIDAHIMVDIPSETLRFISYWRRKAKPVKAPDQAWRNWIRNAIRFQKERSIKAEQERKAKEAEVGQFQVEWDV